MRDVSPLASLVLGVIPAAPGVVWVLRGTGWRGLWCVGAVVAGAAPPVLATVGGLLRHDPFLLYRESSTSGLGVPGTQGVIGAMGALALLAFVLAVGIVTRSSVWIALPIGLVVCWAWVAENDVWGANQEPYRFWLDGYVLVAVLAVPLVAWAAVETLGGERAGRVGRTSGPAVASAQDEGQPQMEVAGLAALPASAVRARRWVSVALVLVVGVTATWSVEFLSFRRDVADWGYVPLTHPFYRASNELLAQTGGEMVAVGGCIDTIIVKVTWGGPIAYYNRGLAWPDEKEAIDMVARARRDSDDFDAPLAVRAGLRWFLVDPACAVDMLEHADTVLVDERTIVLDGDSTPVGTVELRRLVDDGTTVAP